MRSDEHDRILRELHARPTRPAHGRDELEEELLARHAVHTRPGRTTTMTNLFKRPVFIMLLIGVMGIAACTVPTETEVEMGHRLTYTFASDGGETLNSVRDVAGFVETYAGVEDVSVNVNEVEGGQTTVDMMIWGRGVAVGDLKRSIAGRFPAMAGAELAEETLSSTVKTSLAENVGHHLFRIEVLEGSDDEVRAQILQQIYESGFDGEADVQVTQDGDLMTIGVEMTQDADGVQTEDEMVLEIIREDDGGE